MERGDGSNIETRSAEPRHEVRKAKVLWEWGTTKGKVRIENTMVTFRKVLETFNA